VEGEGRVFTNFPGRYGGLKGYFVARFNQPLKSYATWSGGETVEGRAEAAGDDAGAVLNFGNAAGKPVELMVGISFVSLENARENLEAEAGGKRFDELRAAVRSDWDSWLSRVRIESPSAEIKTIFYTNLYHSMIMPTNFTDVNGQYLGFEEEVGTAEDFTYRTDMSIWDTFRSEHPLLLLIAPEIQRDSLKSIIRMARSSGHLPRWPSGGGEADSMFGSPADMLVAESYLKGMTDFEVEEAYDYMKVTAAAPVKDGSGGRDYITDYNAYGYVPADAAACSVSHTLEYAWADGSIALLADALGKTEDAALFRARSMNYKNVFNPATKYFQGRNKDGSWTEPFSPYLTTYYDDIFGLRLSAAYEEGGARHWRWTAVQDTQGLIDLFGRDYFVSELNQFMKDAAPNRAALNPGSGYWQGNQHDMHAIYLFDDAGRPELTQKWVRWALTERYSGDRNGLDGNDDGGTLGSWYVFSAVGLYPAAGTDRYWLGSPIVDKAVLHLGGGKTLTVIAENQSEKNMYVQSAVLNGVKLSAPCVLHSQIKEGGTLVVQMGSKPAAGGGY
jgi:predicted alpha-1,2-mannosidase